MMALGPSEAEPNQYSSFGFFWKIREVIGRKCPCLKPPRRREADGLRNPIRENGRTNQEGEGGGRALAYMTPHFRCRVIF